MAWLTALLHARRAILLHATRRQFRFAEADFARVAGIDTRIYLRARSAHRRVVQVCGIAAWNTAVFRSEVYGDAGHVRQFATAEAIASVRHERRAIIEARRRLRRVVVGAGFAARETCVRIVGALRRLRLQWVTTVVPEAVIVAGPRVGIEVAVHLARRVVCTGNATVERIFGVVARTEALVVLRIDFAIAVVIEAVAASVNFALARGHGAEATASACGRIAGLPASAKAVLGRRYA